MLVMLLSGTAQAITNGQPDEENNWPYVGLVVFDVYVEGVGNVPAWRCTGSLISPRAVLCAGHCTEGAVAARVWFDWNLEDDPGHYPWPGPDAVEVKEIHTHPDWEYLFGGGLKGFITHDVGILILEKKVKMDEYGELPTEGLVDTLPMKTDVDLVGYGVQEMHRGGGQPYWMGLRTRYFASAQLVQCEGVIADEFVKVTANPGQETGGLAFGDSGGPVLLGGTNTILAVNSFVNTYECTGVTYSCRVDTADVLEWIRDFLPKRLAR